MATKYPIIKHIRRFLKKKLFAQIMKKTVRNLYTCTCTCIKYL